MTLKFKTVLEKTLNDTDIIKKVLKKGGFGIKGIGGHMVRAANNPELNGLQTN